MEPFRRELAVDAFPKSSQRHWDCYHGQQVVGKRLQVASFSLWDSVAASPASPLSSKVEGSYLAKCSKKNERVT